VDVHGDEQAAAEAGLSSLNSRWGGQPSAGALMDFTPVVELLASPSSGGVPVGFFAYRAPWSFFRELRSGSTAQRVAGVGVVRDRLAQLQGWVRRRLPDRETDPEFGELRDLGLFLPGRVADSARPADQRPELEQPRPL
jgi:hypothetical protein